MNVHKIMMTPAQRMQFLGATVDVAINGPFTEENERIETGHYVLIVWPVGKPDDISAVGHHAMDHASILEALKRTVAIMEKANGS